MNKQIRLSKKLINQMRDMMINLHMKGSMNSGNNGNASLFRAVDLAMTHPEDLMLVLLTLQTYISNNLNDLVRLESYLVDKYNFDLLRPYKEL